MRTHKDASVLVSPIQYVSVKVRPSRVRIIVIPAAVELL